ncbi:hypothetical protein [Actinoplanes sp. NPDC049118]|uniref:hypothetical protein n=1 Tax=Actinoplanes sp. NPDC049118 TaxID=3155769 RepID=UPI003405E565
MSQSPPAGPFGAQPDDQPAWPQAGPPAAMAFYPGSQPAYGAPPFDPSDPLVSADYAGWWRRGFAVVRRGWRPLALVQAVTAIPALALLIPIGLYEQLAAARSADDPFADTFEFGRFLTVIGTAGLAAGLAGLIYAIGTLVSARLVVTIATGGEVRVGRAVRAVLPRVPALIGWSLLAGLIAVAAVFACILPAFYVGAVFVLLPVVVLFEPGNAISRCFRLFNHDFGASVGRIATIVGLSVGGTLLFGAASVVVTMLATGSAFVDPTTADTGAIVASSLLDTVFEGVATLIVGVVVTPLTVAAYADLRARLEPFTTAYLAAE